MNISKIIAMIETKGWARIPEVFNVKLIEEVKEEYNYKEKKFISIQKKKGIYNLVENATHHTILECKNVRIFRAQYNYSNFRKYFEGKYILNTMGLSKVPIADKTVYTQNIHRDVRTFTGSSKLWLNTLIMLDDSTDNNGSTWFLEGSHLSSNKPARKYFYDNAVRANGQKGDVLLFDGNIWHSAGINSTNTPRHIITPIFSKPFIKQQLDYPRAFGDYIIKNCSDHLKQILGYNALVPSSLDEFYQKDENRFYKKDQG